MSGFANGSVIFKIRITKISQIYLKEKKSWNFLLRIFFAKDSTEKYSLRQRIFSVFLCGNLKKKNNE